MRRHEHGHGGDDDHSHDRHRLHAQHETDDMTVTDFEQPGDQVVVRRPASLQQKRRGQRHQSHRHHHRADHGPGDGQSHRSEDAAFDALEGEDRNQCGDEDQLCEKHRAGEVGGGMAGEFAEVGIGRGEHFIDEDRFDDHDGGIDEDAEIDRAEREQIRRDAVEIQHQKRRQQ